MKNHPCYEARKAWERGGKKEEKEKEEEERVGKQKWRRVRSVNRIIQSVDRRS